MGMPYYLPSEKTGEIIKIEPAFHIACVRVEQWDGKSWGLLSGHDSDNINVEISDDGIFFTGSTTTKSAFNSLSIGGFLFNYIRVTAPGLPSSNVRICFSISFVDSINKDVDEFSRFIKQISASPVTQANLGSAQSAGASVVIDDYKKMAKSDGRGYKHDLNLYVEYPSRISQAMRDVLYGNATKKAISFIGHSVVYGQNTGASESDYKTSALPARIAARLNAYLGTALDTGAIFCASQQQSLWTLASGAIYRTDIAGNAYSSIQLQAANTASVSVTGTSVIIYMLAAATGITVSYAVDGGGSITAPAAVANSTGDGVWHYYPVTITGLSAGAHTIVITGPATSKVMVVGIEGRSSSTGVVVHRAGNPSYVLSDMLAVSMDATDTSGNSTWRSAADVNKVRQLGSLTTLLSPSLTMLMFDVNDLIRGWQVYSYSLADCKRHLKNTLTALATQGQSVLVVIGPWLATTSYAAGCPFTQDDLAMVYREAISESANASLIDIRTPLYSRQGFSNPMMDAYAHPTAVGANALGQKIADAMIESASWF